MRHTSASASLLLVLGLAACGTTPSVSSEERGASFDSGKPGNMSTEADPVKVAQYLAGAGFTKEDAERVINGLQYVKNDNLNSQNIQEQDALDRNKANVQAAMRLILDDKVKINSPNIPFVSPQTVYARSTVVNGAQNISLYSTSNFQYYQSRNYLAPDLDYFDNGCSAPEFFFAANATFYPACDQHDFGYRNGLYSELHNPSFKQAVDTNFLNNMNVICDTRWQGSWIDKAACRYEAANFYQAVSNQLVTARWLTYASK